MAEVELDLKVLEERLSGLGVTRLRPLSGGASSLSYVGEATSDGGPRQLVVKVAPAGLPPRRNRDVLRQARILRLLADTGVPVPEVIWEDPGAPVAVPPLFVMAFVEGTSLEPLFDRDGTDGPELVSARMLDAARVLATLHSLDRDEIGLSDEQEVGINDEVARWTRLLETVDPGLAPGWPHVAERLLADVPPPVPPTLVHGDFRLGNLLADGPEITAVVDWEIWSVGDPRIDLGWFLINAEPETYRRRTRYAGLLPSSAELAATYAEHLGGEATELGWFQALACFKSTATWALIVKHNRRRSDPDPEAEEVAGALPHLLERALALLD